MSTECKPVYLIKSLFKIGFECTANLRFGKDACCGNNQKDNEFLQALAEGEFQAGELAKGNMAMFVWGWRAWLK